MSKSESLSCSFLKRDGSNSLSSLSNICYAFFLLHNFCVPFFFLLIFYRQLYYCVSYFLSIFYAHPFFLSPSPPPLLPLSILRFLTTNHIPPPPSPHRKGGGWEWGAEGYGNIAPWVVPDTCVDIITPARPSKPPPHTYLPSNMDTCMLYILLHARCKIPVFETQDSSLNFLRKLFFTLRIKIEVNCSVFLDPLKIELFWLVFLTIIDLFLPLYPQILQYCTMTRQNPAGSLRMRHVGFEPTGLLSLQPLRCVEP